MVTLAKQETVVNYQREGDEAIIWTSDTTQMTRLDRLCKDSPEFYSLHRVEKTKDGSIVGKFYKLTDKSLVSFRSKKTTRTLSDEQREALRDRLAKTRNKSDSLQ